MMSNATTGLMCPKCQGVMNSYERNGVTMDQCRDCRGVFLDRGELEHLVDAESAFYQRAAAPAPAMANQQWGNGKQHSGGHDRGRESHGDGGYNNGRRKRGGFLGDLFD